MTNKDRERNGSARAIDDVFLWGALAALGRSINMVLTYGNHHPAFIKSVSDAEEALGVLFLERWEVNIGALNGVLLVDEEPAQASGILLKSLERRLIRLQITNLRLGRGISTAEIAQLAKLLATTAATDFKAGIKQAGLVHITSESARYERVNEDEVVAKEHDLAGGYEGGILVIEDEVDTGSLGAEADQEPSVQVDQIVAFLQGDMDLDEADLGEELTQLAADPDRLGKMILESVAIRQSAAELSGESLNDVILGCLRRTFDGLRQQPAFKSTEGVADLKKSLLLLEKSMLDKLRTLTEDNNPELDRHIVQAIREMDEVLGFELAATEYIEHREALLKNEKQLQSYVQSKGADRAEDLIGQTDFPPSDWRRIVVNSGRGPEGDGGSQILAGLSSLTTVFEKLEHLMKSEDTDEGRLETLLGQATDKIDITADSTKEKLDLLSKQLDDTGTIGGHARIMSRKELLSSISEISQELMQPLTAINASLEMMLNGYVGGVNQEQRTMLELASNSGIHLTYLMKELIDIVGCPTNKGVDERFHRTSNEVVLLEKQSG